MSEKQNFADSIAQHLPYLNRIVCRLMHGDQMSEDIVQETVLKALTHADQFRFESTLKTWLASIAINEVYQLYRSAQRRRSVPLIPESLETNRLRPGDPFRDSYEARERDALVRTAVSRLPHTYRSVLELCDLQSLSLAEAARKLGLTLPAVKTRRHRARQKLRPLAKKLKLS